MVFYRRRLPHWQPQEKALFITWRLYGSLPATVARQHRKQAAAADHKVLRQAPASRQARRKFLCLGQSAGFRKVRTALAGGPGRGQACREGHARGEKASGQLYRLHAYAVMPNHVHILARPGGVPGTDHQGSERVHCPASEQNPGADRTGGCVSTRSRRDRLSRALASVSESIW